MSEHSEPIQLGDILITDELARRSPRQPDWQAENQAMRSLAWQLAQASEQMLQRLVELAVELCEAGTAGVNLSETQPDGKVVFRWVAMVGHLASYMGDCVPYECYSCGICLDQRAPLLFSHPERYFTGFQQVGVPLVESLVLPLIAEGQTLGTIWIMTHDAQRQFDSEDVRLITGLADFAAATLLRQQQQARELSVAGTALQQESVERKLAEERSIALIDNLPGGAAFVVDRDLRYTMAAGEALAIAHFQPTDFIGRTIFEVMPPDLAATYEPMYRMALAGEPFECEHQAHNRWYISRGTPLRTERGKIYGVLAVSYDITDRKRAETALQANAEQQSFLLKLSDALRPLADADAIHYQAACILGQHLGANRVGYAEADDNDETIVVTRHYTQGVPGIEGRYRYDDYGAELLQEFEDGRMVIRDDIANDPSLSDAEKTAHAVLQLGATVNVPLLKAGRLVAVLFVHFQAAHQWLDSELQLIAEVAERIWDAVRRARAEAALRLSEEKYRGLFDSIDVGFCIIEVLFDPQEKPFDYRFLEANPAFIGQTGLTHAIGKTILKLVPAHETFWFDVYGKIALTGKSMRFEHQAAALPSHPWYEVYAFRIGEPEARQVAVLFRDIADRKRSEAQLRAAAEVDAFRVKLSDALRSLSDPIAIQRAASRIVGEHLEADRVFYTITLPDDVTTVIHDNYVREGVPKVLGSVRVTDVGNVAEQLRNGETVVLTDVTTGELTEAEKAAYAQIDVVAAIAVPLVKGNRWVATLVIHSRTLRQWTIAEVALVQETAERTWAAVERANAEATTAADLRDTQRLRELSARLTSEEDTQVLYNEIMAAAIALTRADAGTVQILDEATQDLLLLATQGFERNMTDYFYRVNASSNTPCGIALARGERTFVDFDVPESEDPDGSYRMHIEAGLRSAQSTPLITRSGRPIGMVSTHWQQHHRPSERELRFLDLLARQAADLIEQRQTEQERRELLQREQAARAEAEQANRVKDEFLAILSHELRSPLSPILGWASILQSRPFNEATTKRALATIERNAKLQTQLIDDLLDVNRILRGKLSLAETAVNLVTVIEAALEVVKTAAQAKSIALHFNSAEACLVWGDEGRLQQVVWNLFSNAIKFTPEGGRVDVRLDCVGDRVNERVGEGSSPRLSISPLPHPAYAQITVTDTGQGISPNFIPHLFESFRQEDASTTRQSGGLGLGLAIVKYLVDAHGGKIAANSPGVGQGATFTVQIPLLQEASTPLTAPASTEVDLTGLKVLAVDDSEDTRDLLAMVLDAYGAETHVAASGAEVLANLATFTPDVLICDIGMPDMDGYALLQQIRALPNTKGGSIPAIAVTAFAREEDRQRALAQGFQHHVAKPIEPQDLVSAIAQLAIK
ncbi:GAF domain-containing protein [Sphaerothrix gracilis]|uniref:GAF domain-containing protein n=1 Tax=Sphaerothrix gracilis TaxID=3151835 RepID=UPI0031FBD167